MVSPRRTGSSGFSIEVGCPGCGADLAMEQDFRLLECGHCGSVLRIVMPDLAPAYYVRPRKSIHEVRFLLERHCREHALAMPAGNAPISLTYYPYWKIDAITLKVRTTVYEVPRSPDEEYDDTSVEEKEATTINLAPYSSTVPATRQSDAMPFSLGLRAEYLALVPYALANLGPDAAALTVTEPLNVAVDRALKASIGLGRWDATDGRNNATLLFHPQGSLIFFPYFLADAYAGSESHRYAVDAVTGRVAGSALLAEDSTPVADLPVVTFGALGVEFHRCTNCGVDLPLGRSLVYACHNCNRVEFLDHHPQLNKSLLFSSGKAGRQATYFPFWVIRATSDTEQSERQFVVPAFEMRSAESTYRLSRRISTAIHRISCQPMYDLIQQEIPVTRSIEESLALLEVLWYRHAYEQGELRRGKYLPCEPSSIQLAFLPFHPERYFYVDSILDAVTFEKAATLAPAR